MALALLVSLTACGNSENQNGAVVNSTAQNGNDSVETGNPLADSGEAADNDGKILITYFTAAENSVVDAIPSRVMFFDM